jgi:thymidine phosphorylase
MELGAGRADKESRIDPAAGIQLLRRAGDEVRAGEPLAMLYAANDAYIDLAEKRFLASVRFSDTPVKLPPLVHEL